MTNRKIYFVMRRQSSFKATFQSDRNQSKELKGESNN